MLWPKSLNKKIKSRVRLAKFTTFKIGGAARFFLEAQSLKDLQEALIFAQKQGIPVFLLGAGSNVLVSDAGLDGLVIKLAGKYFREMRVNGVCLEAGCGVKLNQLMLYAKNRGLSGLEFLAGIPGTLGGALIMNAGAWGKSIGDMVEEVRVLDYNGKSKLLKKRQLKFSYRKSNLGKYIVLWVKLKLAKGSQPEIGLRINQLLKQRSKTQENILPNAGCIFKNPAEASAGKLIEACGLKNRVVGGAIISGVHANFILNRGRAKSEDVLALMRLMRKEVKENFKVDLEPEIILWK